MGRGQRCATAIAGDHGDPHNFGPHEQIVTGLHIIHETVPRELIRRTSMCPPLWSCFPHPSPCLSPPPQASFNALSSLPPSMGYLPALELMRVAVNRLPSVPTTFAHLDRLVCLPVLSHSVLHSPSPLRRSLPFLTPSQLMRLVESHRCLGIC